MKMAKFRVTLKSCIIVGPGTAISVLWTSRPDASTR